MRKRRCPHCDDTLHSPRSLRHDETRALYEEGVITYEVARQWWQEDTRLFDEPFRHICPADPSQETPEP